MNIAMRAAALAAITGAIALAGSGASANTLNGSMPVSVTVSTTCTTFSATPINFGTVVTGAGASTVSSISVNCSANSPYKILLSAGLNYNASTGQRNMSTGSLSSVYGIYKDAGHSQLWGDDNATINETSVSGTGTGSTQTYTTFDATSGPNASGSAGQAYSDTVTATLSF